MNRIIAVLASTVFVFGCGYVAGTQHHAAPICIVINSDGNPAPSPCSNPNSYQVNQRAETPRGVRGQSGHADEAERIHRVYEKREDCERCGQPSTKQNPTFKYFAEGKWLHTSCFEAYADEVLKESK